MKRLSIVIVTYKSEEDIYDCLQSIWQYNDIPNEDLEVIVVDNSPESEMMFSKLRELYKNDIVLIHNTHNGGYGQGNNVGIKQAKAPTIMIMNPDVRLCQPIFRTALEAFANVIIHRQKPIIVRLFTTYEWLYNSFHCHIM